MKVLIVEDEPMAQANLSRILQKWYPDIEIIGKTDSVASTVEWLKANDSDVIFMDVELSDGNCFEIFRQVDVDAKVVMTTAYDNYAVRAFDINSVDYLLKPIEKEALDRAVDRCRKRTESTDIRKIINSLGAQNEYRQRLMVRLNNKILPVSVDDIAYFISEDKVTWICLKENTRYIIDSSLDILSSQLPPDRFFRISRSCIIALSAIASVIKLPGGRLKINEKPASRTELLVSRSRCDDFLLWLEQ